MSPVDRTQWWRVIVVFLAGCFGASQIGKASAALSLIISDLGLSLFQAGLVISTFTLTAALTGIVFGVLADRFGHLRAALTGLLLSAAGAFAGSGAEGITFLLLTRTVEGLGFILAIVALPPLISQACTDHDRPLAMGLWGAFKPDDLRSPRG